MLLFEYGLEFWVIPDKFLVIFIGLRRISR